MGCIISIFCYPLGIHGKSQDAPFGRAGRNGRVVSNSVGLQVELAFSLEEAPCGSAGFFTLGAKLSQRVGEENTSKEKTGTLS